MRAALKRISLVGVLALTSTTLSAWDTLVIEGKLDPDKEDIAWQSIYQTGTPKSIPEHSMNSDRAFMRLDPSGDLKDIFGRAGSAQLTAVDLNASLFREDRLYGVDKDAVDTYGDEGDTEVEERLIPPPGLFAGVPDYSFAIYDWLNKNQTCPAFESETYTSKCHEFIGWLGGLNSVHFGTQAKEMYAHHHRNAVALAERAAEMYEAMTPEERLIHREALLEAEHLALVYEGYAQHFLQDRWAIGHMWERWGSPDSEQLNKNLAANIIIGGLAGLIHGAEALIVQYSPADYIFTAADPMSSPLSGNTLIPGSSATAIPMKYVHVRKQGPSEPVPAIGDERLQDSMVGSFSLSKYRTLYPDEKLDVAEQSRSFLNCAAAGWAEVFRSFGQDGNKAGQYGAYKATLSYEAPNFLVLQNDDCWNMWATNQSMVTGLLGKNPEVAMLALARLNWTIDDAPQGGAEGAEKLLPFAGIEGSRQELINYAALMWLYARLDRNGTQIAQGQMQSFRGMAQDFISDATAENASSIPLWGFEHGGKFSSPNYIEPVGLTAQEDVGDNSSTSDHLPWHNVRGRDIQTLYGVFNQAHSDYWCDNRTVLEEEREKGTKRSQEICQRLASYSYQGTHPSYNGAQSRTLKHEDTEVRSLCAIRDKGVEAQDYNDRNNPFWINQGYQPFGNPKDAKTPFTKSDVVANWCGRAPLIDLVDEPDLLDENVAAEIYAGDTIIRFVGWDFGDVEGNVSAIRPDGEKFSFNTILDWTDTYIEIDVSDETLNAGEDYRIEVSLPRQETRPLTDSVGLFYLRVLERESIPEVREVILDINGAGPCGDPVPQFKFVDLDASMPERGDGDDVEDLLATYQADMAVIRPYLEEQLACMKSLRGENLEDFQSLVSNYPKTLKARTSKGVESYEYRMPRLYSGANLDEDLNSIGTEFSMPTLNLPSFGKTQGTSRADGPSNEFEDFVPLDGDIYTRYINELSGVIRSIEGTEYLLGAWVQAFNDTDQFLTAGHSPRDSAEMLARASGVDEYLSGAFIDLMDDRTLRKALLNRSVRRDWEQRRWDSARTDIGTTGLFLNDLISSLPQGLKGWTQMEHTISNILVPNIESEVTMMEREGNKRFNAYIEKQLLECQERSARAPEWAMCSNLMLDSKFHELDEELIELTAWLDRLYQSHFIAIDGAIGISLKQALSFDSDVPIVAVRQYYYYGEDGGKRLFYGWPGRETAQIAKDWPTTFQRFGPE